MHAENQDGYIEQSTFKSVLGCLGITLTLSELIKIVKVFPIDKRNHINYYNFMERIGHVEPINKTPLNKKEFFNTVKKWSQNFEKIPLKLPMSVNKVASVLQSELFKDDS